MAIVARCCLHTMYEFTAFMNMWAVESLGVSGGVAAQASFISLLQALLRVCKLHLPTASHAPLLALFKYNTCCRCLL